MKIKCQQSSSNNTSAAYYALGGGVARASGGSAGSWNKAAHCLCAGGACITLDLSIVVPIVSLALPGDHSTHSIHAGLVSAASVRPVDLSRWQPVSSKDLVIFLWATRLMWMSSFAGRFGMERSLILEQQL